MRTEQEILMDFGKLGYNKFYRNFVNTYIECSINEDIILCIDLENKTFSKYADPEDRCFGEEITMQELKLLNELFELWGWL